MAYVFSLVTLLGPGGVGAGAASKGFIESSAHGTTSRGVFVLPLALGEEDPSREFRFDIGSTVTLVSSSDGSSSSHGLS